MNFYRAWSFDDKEMYDCASIATDRFKGEEKWITMIVRNGYINILEGEYIIMQFSGIYDCNANCIFEGDIISTDLDSGFNIVKKINNQFVFECFDNNVKYEDFILTPNELLLGNNLYKYGKVIGNIYENKEILEGF